MSPVNQQVQALLDEWEQNPSTPPHRLTPDIVRKEDRNVEAYQPPFEKVADIRMLDIPNGDTTIPVKLYYPSVDDPALPMLIYFHGGGFVIGMESYESPLRALTNRSGCLVAAVDYRLAPEHPFPAALEDIVIASQWLSENAAQMGGDPTRIAIGGDSCGGNFAAVLSIFNREKPMFDCKYQVLVYPCLDATMSQPSMETCGDGYGFSTEKMAWYYSHYLPADVDRERFDISPLFVDDFSDLPPAYIATAEFDPLRDEAELYARYLEKAGVDVRHKRYRGMVHGFMQMAQAVDKGQALIDDIGNILRDIMVNEEA